MDLIGIITILLVISCALSTVGSFFILLSFVLLRDWSFPSNFIFFLSICDFFYATEFFYLNPPENWICIIQAVWGNFWGLGALFWTLAIAITYWSQSTKYKHKIYAYEKYFHFAVWIPAFVLSVLPVFFNDYGVDPGERNFPKCWIRNTDDFARVWATYGEVVFVMLSITALYIHVLYKHVSWKRRIQGTPYQSISKEYRLELVRMGMYPLVLWIVWLVPCITRVLQYMYPDKRWDPLLAITAFIMPLQGFLNALVYGFRNNLMEKLKSVMFRRQSRYLPIGDGADGMGPDYPSIQSQGSDDSSSSETSIGTIVNHEGVSYGSPQTSTTYSDMQL